MLVYSACLKLSLPSAWQVFKTGELIHDCTFHFHAYPGEMNTYIHMKTCVNVHSSSIIMAKTRKPKCSSVDEWRTKCGLPESEVSLGREAEGEAVAA